MQQLRPLETPVNTAGNPPFFMLKKLCCAGTATNGFIFRATRGTSPNTSLAFCAAVFGVVKKKLSVFMITTAPMLQLELRMTRVFQATVPQRLLKSPVRSFGPTVAHSPRLIWPEIGGARCFLLILTRKDLRQATIAMCVARNTAF